MAAELHHRSYAEGDEEAIRDLYEITFGRPYSSEAWRWRYLENPAGPPMVELMFDQDRLVGHYGGSPMRVDVDGSTYLGCLALDSMTHPDYGRRGIFVALGLALYERLADDGCALVYGFPNVNALPPR